MRRRRTWPRVDLYQKHGPGDMKVASADVLESLMSEAAMRQWSAEGRPSWFRERRDQFASAVLVVFGEEGVGAYRCIATVILGDGSGGRFTLDVAKNRFDKLDDLDDRILVTMAHRYLAEFQPVELNPEADVDQGQSKTWENSVWKRWGETESE